MKNMIYYLMAIFLCCSAKSFAEQRLTIPASAVKASSSYQDEKPYKAVDGNFNTWWNSGGFPSKWIEIDLGTVTPVSKIKLTPQQSPNGNTTHKIYVGESSSSMRLVRTVSSHTSSGITFEVPIVESARYIKITTTNSPSWVAWSEIEVYKAENWIKYYGYYCSACFWVGGGNYIGATSGHSNLVHITSNDSLLIEKIREAKSYNMHVHLDVSSVFFNGKNLRNDYMTAWYELNNKISNEIGSIAAFYVVDEPNNYGFTRSTLQLAINALKVSYPQIPVSAIYSLQGNGYDGIDLFDWVGLDCYDNGSGSCHIFETKGPYGTTLEGKYDIFRSKLDTSRQKIILVPQAGIPVESVNYTAVNINLPSQAEQYYQLAITDPIVIAMTPFIWQTFNDGSAFWYGAETFPALRNKFTEIGRNITKK